MGFMCLIIGIRKMYDWLVFVSDNNEKSREGGAVQGLVHKSEQWQQKRTSEVAA